MLPPTTLTPAPRQLGSPGQRRGQPALHTLAPPALITAQIYRAEYWSKQLGAKHALPMLSISLLMIAGISLASLAAVHPYSVAHYLANLPELAGLLRGMQ